MCIMRHATFPATPIINRKSRSLSFFTLPILHARHPLCSLPSAFLTFLPFLRVLTLYPIPVHVLATPTLLICGLPTYIPLIYILLIHVLPTYIPLTHILHIHVLPTFALSYLFGSCLSLFCSSNFRSPIFCLTKFCSSMFRLPLLRPIYSSPLNPSDSASSCSASPYLRLPPHLVNLTTNIPIDSAKLTAPLRHLLDKLKPLQSIIAYPEIKDIVK